MTATIILKSSRHADPQICVALDEKCKDCTHHRQHPCPKCHGRGTVPTEAGKAILELVRRYAK